MHGDRLDRAPLLDAGVLDRIGVDRDLATAGAGEELTEPHPAPRRGADVGVGRPDLDVVLVSAARATHTEMVARRDTACTRVGPRSLAGPGGRPRSIAYSARALQQVSVMRRVTT